MSENERWVEDGFGFLGGIGFGEEIAALRSEGDFLRVELANGTVHRLDAATVALLERKEAQLTAAQAEAAMWRRRTEEAEGQRSGLVGDIDRQRGEIAVLTGERDAALAAVREIASRSAQLLRVRSDDEVLALLRDAAALTQQPATERAQPGDPRTPCLCSGHCVRGALAGDRYCKRGREATERADAAKAVERAAMTYAWLYPKGLADAIKAAHDEMIAACRRLGEIEAKEARDGRTCDE